MTTTDSAPVGSSRIDASDARYASGASAEFQFNMLIRTDGDAGGVTVAGDKATRRQGAS
mgnify:CR=1 FL=1